MDFITIIKSKKSDKFLWSFYEGSEEEFDKMSVEQLRDLRHTVRDLTQMVESEFNKKLRLAETQEPSPMRRVARVR